MTDLFIILNAFILRIFNPNPMAVIIRVRFPKLYTNIVVSVDQTLCKAESAMIELVTVEEFSVCKLVTDPILRQGALLSIAKVVMIGSDVKKADAGSTVVALIGTFLLVFWSSAGSSSPFSAVISFSPVLADEALLPTLQ